MYKIKQFANRVGISIRMLRHYDKIGLLVPENINQYNGYRYYGSKNLETMQQILFFKELDFSLKEIKDMINHQSFDKHEALSMQKNLLNLQKQRLENMVEFIDTLLSTSHSGEIDMSKKLKQAMSNESFESQKQEYAKEAKQKWGETDSYKQSQRRAANYSKQEIAQINAKQQEIYQDLVQLMPLGVTNEKVQEKVHQARMLINDFWYDCSPQQFAALGQMYIADERFKHNIDKQGQGLAEFLNKAIQIYVS
jgi:DNA-binding transcriptional MerR regulator